LVNSLLREIAKKVGTLKASGLSRRKRRLGLVRKFSSSSVLV